MAYYLTEAECDLDAFKAQVTRTLTHDQVPLSQAIEKNIPIYDASDLDLIGNSQAIRAEWGQVLGQLSGVFAIKNAYPDTAPIDAATRIYEEIIAEEKRASGGGADHFAASGANDRIWNSLQKLCQRDPQVFAAYFGNVAVDLACQAWLGPNYQMTAQVNVVRPGGAAQAAHRDYHLGFQTKDRAMEYPAHVHDLSPVLTLQGAIVHIDMPIESGPTKLLPFSQMFQAGYLAFTRPEFREFFEANCVQLPLSKGDCLFFSPALYHAAGANVSEDVQRMANLVQISSAFGIAMESIDRDGMCRAIYPVLSENPDGLSPAQIDAAISSTAYGYSFPTNLDTDPPIGGLAPETQAAQMRRALVEGMSAAEFEAALDAQNERRKF